MARYFRLTKPQLFTILMVAAALCALLPLAWTRWTGGLLQPLGAVTSPLTAAARGTAETADAVRHGLPASELEAAQAEAEALRRQLGHQSLAIHELEQRVDHLTSIREQIRDYRTRLRLARVIGFDASLLRETLLISRGSSDGIAVGQWVVAASTAPAEATGRDRLTRAWLVGRVSEVFPYASRVRLATDPHFVREPVRIARILPDGTWQPIGDPNLLSGVGQARMRIEQATEDTRSSGGEIVIVPASATLPADLTIGRITAARRAKEPLFYDLDVEPWGDARRLAEVYVVVGGS